MIALAALAAGALVCVLAWTWAAAGLHTGTRVAVVVVLAAAAVAFNTLVPIPNVEATSTVVICVAATLGLRSALAVAVLAVVGSDVASGIGLWAVWQAIGFALLAAAAHLLARVVSLRADSFDARLWFAAAAVPLTFVYDAVVTIASIVVTGAVAPGRYGYVLLAGLPFSTVHAAATAAMLLLAGPALLRALNRASLRLDACVGEDTPRLTVHS